MNSEFSVMFILRIHVELEFFSWNPAFFSPVMTVEWSKNNKTLIMLSDRLE